MAQDPAPAKEQGLAQRVEALENKLANVTTGPGELTITGANLRIVNGLGDTETTNGVGNLIVGYNEQREPSDGTVGPDNRSGSHNVVVGKKLNFSRFGGLVIGVGSEISGDFASVSGGSFNIASANFASVSGGSVNTASGLVSAVSGGVFNTASGDFASVSGGLQNTASGGLSSVSGGRENTAGGDPHFTSEAGTSSVSGGFRNSATGQLSSVSGGSNRTAPGTTDWAAGSLFADF